ncbi:radical SAM protein [Streptomyces wedmorensis]|uniref:radical SAM protein n=1 Tax=Streptomyces wedmorensis TaxID=43759 RepID=UPI003F4D5996
MGTDLTRHELIVAPFLGRFLVLRPGQQHGVEIPLDRYTELANASAREGDLPQWLTDAAKSAWALDLTGWSADRALLVRAPSPYGYARASYEINKGCNYNCPHCYLPLRPFEGLPSERKRQVIDIMRDAGVLWLQITGGEPLIDREFPATYQYAYDAGMMIAVSSNGSELRKPNILSVFRERPPYRLTFSLYGATAATYDGFTRSKGAYGRFIESLDAARDAGLPVRLNIIVSKDNAHELDAMEALAEGYGFPHQVFTNMSPTIDGGAAPLPTQATEHLRQRRPFTGCNAGHTFFHVDPLGHASICKVARDPHIVLPEEGIEGLRRLGAIADGLQLRTGGCSGCALSGTCWTCRPLAKLYQEAKAPREMYCQHTERVGA